MSGRNGIVRLGSFAGLLTAALILLAPGLAGAQTGFGNKWYGEVRPPAPPRTLGMGALTAVHPWGGESTALGYRNPALAGWAEHVLYGLTWEVGRMGGDYPDGAGRLWQTGPRMTGILAPFGRGLVAQIVLGGITNSEFEVHNDAGEVAGVPVRFDYLGKGGLSLGTVGLAWAHPSGLAAVGVSWDILFGSLKKEWRVEFTNLGYVDTYDKLERQHRGTRLTLGLSAHPTDRIRMGLAYSPRAVLDVTQVYTASNTVADTSDAEMELGGSLLAGLGVRLSELWSVYADYRREEWDKTKWLMSPTDPTTGVGTGISDFSGFRADWDIGVGIERQARPLAEQAAWYDTFPVRAGLRWGSIYAPDLDGGSVNQVYGTLGTSIAFGRGDRVWGDLALVIGRRSGSSGISESFWRIQIGMTGAENWFQPPQR